MRNGFTLVELLAVIVILAVLALIATPVVLSIIDDTKESAMLRSAEMYLSGVENAVMRENMNSGGNFRPNDCTISKGTLSCNGTTVEVEVNGEVPKEGTIVFENGKIKEVELIYESGTIIKDDSGNLVYEGSSSKENTLATICTYLDNGVAEKTAGAKYSCEVKPGTSYNFYVLTTPQEGDTTINLIMDQSINSDGTPAGVTEIYINGENVYNQVEWYAAEESNINGPVTAMTYLYNATKDWTNITPMNYIYKDREIQGTTRTDEGYESFISTNGVAIITKGDSIGTQVIIGTSSEPLRARMPIYSVDESITEIPNMGESNSFYAENLGTGYWTMSALSGQYMVYNTCYSVIIHPLNSSNFVIDEGTSVISTSFVRPVITLKM